jgi:hypothetical protein
MDSRKVLENILALTEVLNIEVDEICNKEVMSASDKAKLEEIKIKHYTIKQIVGEEKLW